MPVGAPTGNRYDSRIGIAGDLKISIVLFSFILSTGFSAPPIVDFCPDYRACHGILKKKDVGSISLWLPFLIKSCGLWTLSCDFSRDVILCG